MSNENVAKKQHRRISETPIYSHRSLSASGPHEERTISSSSIPHESQSPVRQERHPDPINRVQTVHFAIPTKQ